MRFIVQGEVMNNAVSARDAALLWCLKNDTDVAVVVDTLRQEQYVYRVTRANAERISREDCNR